MIGQDRSEPPDHQEPQGYRTGGACSWADLASSQLQEAKFRREFFGDALANEQAINILLSIYVSQGIEIPFGIRNAAEIAGCSEATTSRWVSILESNGLVQISAQEDRVEATLATGHIARAKIEGFLKAIADHRKLIG